MKPVVDMKRCFASQSVCKAIKVCPVKAITYCEAMEPILDKALKCNCSERKALGLSPMSDKGYSTGCDCGDGCDSTNGDPLYACNGSPYGRIIIDYEKCIECGVCARECCGTAIDMMNKVSAPEKFTPKKGSCCC